MTELTPEQKLKLRQQQYLDLKEYQSKFLLTPDVEDDADFSHLDKNLAITNLKHNVKLGIDEPAEARSILKGLHVLNNTKYYEEEKIIVLAGYREETNKNGSITQIPVYREEKKLVPIFPKAFHNLKSSFISLTNTAAARNGHRIDKAISNKIVQESTLTDKTDVKNKMPFARRQSEHKY